MKAYADPDDLGGIILQLPRHAAIALLEVAEASPYAVMSDIADTMRKAGA